MRVAAVDLGATSGRVCVADLRDEGTQLDVVHRFAHAPVTVGDSLRWDWDRLVDEVRRGLTIASDGGPLASIGVDTWGVDYGLLDHNGSLLSAPYCYRDNRTSGWRDIAARLGEDRLYATTGIQLMGINTIFQLAAHDREELAGAHSLLMLPELLVHSLTDEKRGERTSAGTTGLVDLATGTWSDDLVSEIGVKESLFPALSSVGDVAGSWEGVPVRLVGGHDTASAFLAASGNGPGRVVVATGSWVLVGVERDGPDTSDAARNANFSNEPGALGGVRFLKNVAGLVLLERCREAWGNPPIGELIAAANASTMEGIVDPDAAADSADVEAFVRREARLSDSATKGDVVRVILASLAARVAVVVDELRALIPDPLTEIAIVGGGVRIELLRDLIAEATGLPVIAGPAEATAWGNAIAQGLALDV